MDVVEVDDFESNAIVGGDDDVFAADGERHVLLFDDEEVVFVREVHVRQKQLKFCAVVEDVKSARSVFGANLVIVV